MPPRLIRDAETGWYGWESRFNYVLRMSNNVMFNTNKKLDREKHRHVRFVKEIKDERRDYDQKSRDELNRLRCELLEMKAYKAVYRKHSLRNYYRSANGRTHKENNENNGKTKDTVKNHDTREPKSELVDDDKENIEVTTSNAVEDEVTNQDGNADKRPNTQNHHVTVALSLPNTSSFQSISIRSKLAEEARQNLVIRKLQILQKTDPFGLKSILNPEDPSPLPTYSSTTRSSMLSFSQVGNMGLAMEKMTTRAAERKRLEQQQAQEVRQRVFPADCKNRFTLARFIEKKKSELYQKWSEPERKKQSKDKLIEKSQFPEVVERTKTTSAIFRDYKSYRSLKGKLFLKKNDISLPDITLSDSPDGANDLHIKPDS